MHRGALLRAWKTAAQFFIFYIFGLTAVMDPSGIGRSVGRSVGRSDQGKLSQSFPLVGPRAIKVRKLFRLIALGRTTRSSYSRST